MNALTLSLRYLHHRLFASMLHSITFASGIAVIVALLLINAQLGQEFSKNLRNIDLVVSGKGSPLQIILSTVFHLDIPTGNIPIDEANALAKHPLVKRVIPMALGDNYNGARIVGTTADYIDNYGGVLAQGRLYAAPMEAVVGSDVAAGNQLALGQKIIGAHGLSNSDDLHTDFPYTIVGILAPSDTVLDRLVLTPVESVWHVHEHPDADDPEEVAYKKEHPGNELTALLITYQSPMAAVSLPREINKHHAMQAASPAFEVARLTGFMGIGADTLAVFGWFLITLAGFGMFTTLYNAMDERRYDLALLRSFGARPAKLFGLVICESLIVALLGIAVGLALGHGLVYVASVWLENTRHIHIASMVFLPEEGWLAMAGIAIGLLAAVIPAIRVYRIDIFKTLVRR